MSATRRPDTPRWTQVEQLVATLRKRWDTGSYLKGYLADEPWQPVELAVKGPTAAEMRDHLDQARLWLQRFDQQAGQLNVEYTVVEIRHLGANRIPARVRIESFDQMCQVLGTGADVQTIEELRSRTRATIPELVPWVSTRPMLALRNAAVWDPVLETVQWIVGHDTSRLYVRQIDVPGVDTRFVERHHRLLEQLLTILLPSYRFNPEALGFARRFRFREKPSYTRLRLLDSDMIGSLFSEMTVRTDELIRAGRQATTIFVVENEATYLAFPSVPRALVVFGSGFALAASGDLSWLQEKDLVYWGDIDTHGFDILDRLRGRFDSGRSILMDRETLLAHPQQWVTEPAPITRPLASLTADEASFYKDLVEGTYGDSVRLEQERIRFSMLHDALQPWLK